MPNQSSLYHDMDGLPHNTSIEQHMMRPILEEEMSQQRHAASMSKGSQSKHSHSYSKQSHSIVQSMM